MRSFRYAILIKICLTALFVFTLTGNGFAQSFDETAFNLPDAAKKIADCISQAEGNQKRMFVAGFRGFGVNDRGLAHAVATELAGNGYTIEPRAPIEIEGRLFRLPSDTSRPLLGVKVNAQLVYATGESRKFTVSILDANHAHSIVSPTGETLPPPTRHDDPAHQSLVSLPKPKIAPTSKLGRLSPSPTSPYAVSIVRKVNGQEIPVPIDIRGGLPWVDLPLGSIYAVRLHNESDFDAGVSVMIDGLSRFALSHDPQKHELRDLVYAHKDRLIEGYFKNTQTVDQFQTGQASRRGTFCVT